MEIIGNYKYNKAIKFTPETMTKLNQLLLKYFPVIKYSCKIENGNEVAFQSLEEMITCENFKSGGIESITINGIKNDDSTTLAIHIDAYPELFVDLEKSVNVKYIYDNGGQETEFIKELNRLLKKSRGQPILTKKKKIQLTLLLAIICALLFILKPMHFNGNLFTSSNVYITYYESYLETENDNGELLSRTNYKTKHYNFPRESTEYQKIEKILKKYSYHMWSSALISKGFYRDSFFYFTFDGQLIIISDAPYIQIENRLYRIGYFGSSKMSELNRELKDILGIK